MEESDGGVRGVNFRRLFEGRQSRELGNWGIGKLGNWESEI